MSAESTDTTPEDSTAVPRVTCERLPIVNAALQRMDVPLVSRLTLENPTKDDIGPIRVRIELDPPIAPTWEHVVQYLRPGEQLVLDERHLSLPLSSERLVNQLEAERGTIWLSVETPDTRQDLRYPLEIQSFNQWLGMQIHPESLACFVQPNHPALVPVLQVAQRALAASTGDPSLQGYQAGDERALRITAALWAAAQSFGIAYINPPTSFSTLGQKVLLPDAVLGDRMGTCLDLTVFLASLLERAGLHPFMVIIEGHAFPGVFLREDDGLSSSMSDDYTEIAKRVDSGRAVVFDSSALAQGVSFADACGVAEVRQLDAASFALAISLHQCRARFIRPLSLRASTFAIIAEPDATIPPVPEVVHVTRATPELAVRPNDNSPTAARLAAGPRRSGPEQASDTAKSAAERRIGRWKGKLLDLSLRNPLLNFRFDGRRSLPLIVHDLATFEDALASREPLSLQPAEASGLRSELLMEQRTGKSMATELARDLLKKRVLVPDLPGAAAVRRLVDMYRMARTMTEETGQTGAWLALGFLEWFETSLSKEPRYAPLILLPVEIQRGSVRDPLRLRLEDDEPRLNTTLLKKLETDFRIDVSGADELPEDENGLDVELIFSRFRALVEPLPRCRVVLRAAVGFFSFTKHMMWLDLEARRDALLENPVVRHLLDHGGRAFPLARPLVMPDALDEHRPPHEDLAVVEADSSQLVAIQAAIDGNSFVLEGPPGTGKSQTITNLIAELMGRGQSVLFVAEKRAAIEVVKERLAQVGLGPFCLDLHSHDATKAEIVQALAEPLEFTRQTAPSDLNTRAQELAKVREPLAATWRTLHAIGDDGVSVWQALTRLDGLLPGPLVRHDFDGAHDGPLSAEHIQNQRNALAELAETAHGIAHPATHPLAASALGEWTPRRQAEVDKALGVADGALGEVDTALAELEVALETKTLMGASELVALLDACAERPPRAEHFSTAAEAPTARAHLVALAAHTKAHVGARADLATRWDLDALSRQPLDALHARFVRWSHAFFLVAFFALFFARRSLARIAKGPLRPNAQIGDDLAKARHLATTANELDGRREELALLLGEVADTPLADAPLDDVRRELDALPTRLAWCDRYRALLAKSYPFDAHAVSRRAFAAALSPKRLHTATTRATTALADVGRSLEVAAIPDAALDTTRAQLHRWHGGLKDLRDWSAYVRARNEARKLELAPFITAYEKRQLAAGELVTAFERAFATWRIEDALSREPSLARFRGADHESRAAAFRKLDDDRQRLARLEIRARIMRRLPDPSLDVGEVAILRAETKKKRRHLPLRKLFAKIPTILPRLKPCVLMSPMSVAQYLDPALALFDVVVFDEASQIPPWDAVGALARGRRAIIVGDSKQMPPTSFFGKLDDDSGDDVEEMESILDECDRSGLPKLSLRWHYRSRHPSLIHFSNARYYDSKLVTFPAAAPFTDGGPGLGVRWIPVAGVYDKGGKRDNKIEAEVVVAEVVRRLRDPATRDKSIGVVTFAIPQRDLIEELLETARQKHPELERHFDPKQVQEPVFIKNLENVQGDERDVIIFSMSYGPDKDGKVALNFGALNRVGGERRLNVAVTRAKESLIVVSSLRPDHIGEGRTSAIGVRHLREFLAYAQRADSAVSPEEVAQREADAAGFVDFIVGRLHEHGYRCDKNIGAPGPRIDVAVLDPDTPGRYLLGVVTDSPVWARFPSLRDREKLGPSVLGRQGWELHRTWSLDVWHDREREIQAILDRLTAIREARRHAPEPSPEPPPEVPALRQEGEADPAHVIPVVEPIEPAVRTTRPKTDPLTWNDTANGPWRAVPYARHPAVSRVESHPQSDPRFHRWVAEHMAEVVRIEGPLFVEDAIRRAFDAWQTPRVGKNMQQSVLAILPSLPEGQRPRASGDILWPSDVEPTTWHDFRVGLADGSLRQVEQIPSREVANAALAILSRTLALDEDQLVGQLMQVFGINRRGTKVVEHFRRGIEDAVSTGHAVREGATLRFIA